MSELTLVEQDAVAHLALARTVRTAAVSISVTTPAEYETAGQMLVAIKGRIKEVEEKRKSWVEPLNKTVKSINAFFKPVITEWEVVVEGLKVAMLAYQQVAAAEKTKAFEAAKQLAMQGIITGTGIDAAQYQQLAATASAHAPAAAGISAREHWSWRVVDATKVPREYLGIDVTKVNAAVHTGKGATSIPGIEVFRDDIMAVRGA